MYEVLNKTQAQSVVVDRRCDAYLRKCGLKVLRFWESDVKKRPEVVMAEIAKAVKG
jgi:very-short-patch-repair endonuclease